MRFVSCSCTSQSFFYPCALVIYIHSCDFIKMAHTCDYAVVLHSCNFGAVFLIVLVFSIIVIVCQWCILIDVYIRYVERRLFCFLFRGFRLPVHSCNTTVHFFEHFVRFVIWKILFTVVPAGFSKMSPSFYFLGWLIAVTCLIKIVGVGTSVNCPQVIFFPEHSENKLYVPFRLPVGPRHIDHCVLSSSVFVTVLSPCKCA